VPRPIPICADESCHTRADLDRLVGRYDAVNIKLDKTGGLTEALLLAEAAAARGFKVMVGCMIGTSLALAPAMLVAQFATIVDLDAPLLLASDRAHGLRYDGSTLYPPEPALWG
jgi:L-alanine-DL-glutamate epimerase-like enolase superfamily enzyme